MRSRTSVIVLAAALLAALVHGASARLEAQSGSTALTGSVSAPDEPTMEGVIVTARAEGATFSVTVVSNAQGKYTFPRSHVAPGKYAVTVRATGYEIAAPGTVDVTAGTTATLDLKLAKTADITKQLTSREWAESLPPSPWVDRTVYNIESCVYCHSLERIVKSKHTPEQWVPVITRMLRYYPDGTASAGTGRGRTMMKEPEGQEAANKSPNWWPDAPDGSGPIPKLEFGQYLSSINMSGGRTSLPFEPKALPRATGKGTRVIITTWDLPRKDTVPHDSDVDSKGNVWYTDESAMFIGRLDPHTGEAKEFPLPPVNREKGDVPGARDLILDKQDNVWFAMRIPTSKSVLHKFEPATQKLTPVEGTQGQFVALQADGSHVWLGFVRVDTKTAKVDGDFRHPPNLPQGKQSTGYGFAVNSKGNPYGTDFRGGNVYGVDVAKNEGTFYPTPRPNMVPRRGKIDAQDRFWFSYYGADTLGMFDTRTNTYAGEWKLPRKYSTPYTASVPDANGYVYMPSNTCDCFFRVDTKSGEIIEYPMPGPPGIFDTKKVTIDPTSKTTVLLFANTRNGQVMRVEPLD
jgi:virginiamycin B lyase